MDLQDLPPEVHDCTESVMDDDPERTKEEAIAICRDQLDMQEAGDDCPDGHVQVAGECVEIEEAEIVPPLDMSAPRILQHGRFNDPIERVEADGEVRYKNIRILTEGIWTDSNSRQPTHYVPENLDLAEDATLNLIHDDDNDVSDIGRLENGRVEDGDLYADFVLHMDNAASEYADENLRATLESGGAKGFGGPSVEIPAEGLEIDPTGPRGYPMTAAGTIDGAALVRDQADKKTGFARQTAERAVALSDGSRETPMVYHLEADDMTDATVPTDALLEAFDVDADDLDLGDDVELADVPVTELVALIAESYGADPAEIMDALDPFIDGDGEGEDVEAQEEEDADDDDDDDDNGDGGEDENDADVDIDMEEQVSALEERIADLEAMVDSLMAAEDVEEATADLADAETVKELSETVEELEDTAEELDERARKLEAEPEKPKALAGDGGEDADAPTGRISEITPSKRY